mgnify:FL=1|tara:strand:+ start:2549 stop:3316 length:768 start_codon:yes stop_codon:yes gene_type:complete
MDKDKKKKAALLDPVIDLVAKTDHEPFGVVDGVNADILDVVQTVGRTSEHAGKVQSALQARAKVKKLLAKTVTNSPAPTIPVRLPIGTTAPKLPTETVRVQLKSKPTTPPKLPAPTGTVSLKPNQIPNSVKGRTLKNIKVLGKGLKGLGKANPYVNGVITGYETVAIASSDKPKKAATNLVEGMADRSAAGEDTPWHGYGGSALEIAENMAKNASQGFLDPAGVIYKAQTNYSEAFPPKVTRKSILDLLGVSSKK